MYWVSPSGFPCYQAYPKWVEKSIRTRIGEKVYRVKFRQDIDKLSPKRQAQGSSPNYVHSLDASCLHLTVNKCAELGIKDFAMVHDSYGTHCNNSAAMATSIRETVHEIFSVDQLAYLKYNLECTNRLTLDPLPSYGAFNIDDVLKSQYIFS
jgi:DNA-directed RNA polymerase